MTAEYEHRSTVNKRYEPPSEEVREAFHYLVDGPHLPFGMSPEDGQQFLRYLDNLDPYILNALMYHARNGGLA